MIQITFPKFRFLGVVRVSIGIENSEKEIIILENSLKKIIHSKKKSSSKEKIPNTQNSITEVEKQWDNAIRESVAKVFS